MSMRVEAMIRKFICCFEYRAKKNIEGAIRSKSFPAGVDMHRKNFLSMYNDIVAHEKERKGGRRRKRTKEHFRICF